MWLPCLGSLQEHNLDPKVKAFVWEIPMQDVLPDQREVLRLGIDIPQGVLQERESQYSYFLIHDGIRKGIRLVFWPSL